MFNKTLTAMAFTISLHQYKDAALIEAIKKGVEDFGVSPNKVSKAIMKVGIEAWNSLDKDGQKELL